MRKFSTTSIAVIGGSILLLFLGIKFNIPYILSLAFGLFGLFMLINGILIIKHKRLGFETTRKNFGPTELYTGISAQLWGGLFVLLSIDLFVIAFIVTVNNIMNSLFVEKLLNHIETWGIIFIHIGVFVFIAGVTRLISGSAGYYKGLADLFERIGGIIPFVIGLFLLVLGILMIASPGIISMLWKHIVDQIGAIFQ